MRSEMMAKKSEGKKIAWCLRTPGDHFPHRPGPGRKPRQGQIWNQGQIWKIPAKIEVS
jgi:hypothetical protein